MCHVTIHPSHHPAHHPAQESLPLSRLVALQSLHTWADIQSTFCPQHCNTHITPVANVHNNHVASVTYIFYRSPVSSSTVSHVYSYLPSFLPKGSSYFTPTHKPGLKLVWPAPTHPIYTSTSYISSITRQYCSSHYYNTIQYRCAR